MVCLEMSTEQPAAAHRYNQKWKQGYLHEITVTVQSDIFWSGRNLLATAIP